MKNSVKMILLVEKVCWGAAFIVLVITGILLSSRERAPSREGGQTAAAPEHPSGANEESDAVILKSFDTYADMIRSRDIFNEKLPDVPLTVAPPIPSISWRLVGVMMAGDPEAVLENQTTRESFFLRKGMTLDGMIVKVIERRRVVLSNNGQDVEISMEEK